MARGPLTFKQSDVVRAWKAAKSEGLDVVRTEITSDGRIILVHHANSEPELSPYEAWKAKRDANAA